MSELSQTQTFSETIPVFCGFRPTKVSTEREWPVRKTLKRSNKSIQALNLPTVISYNMRSIWPKIKSLANDLHEREAEICFLSEVWEKRENPKHKAQLEKMFEMSNIEYISTPRPGAKRGGGAAIAINTNRFSVKKLNIAIPKPLEIVWALLRPLENSGDIKKIILCSFYCPPKSKMKSKLIDHISVTYNKLRTEHPQSAFLMSGDKNDLDDRKILCINPHFRQIVADKTRKDSLLTVIITDLHTFYQNPEIIPPIPVDFTDHGVPSDHSGVFAVPVTSCYVRQNDVKRISVRPIPESGIRRFALSLENESWSFLSENMTSTEMVESRKFC